MNAQAEKLNRYGFMVDKKADKHQIKRAVEEIYGVKVVSVNT
ncbi:MAG: 50S ribosomal protein L23, partial [Prolixibacteraceae bacterium]|nr:50S ribosomal protein L23 [Prolixibacteraceae bacterium]